MSGRSTPRELALHGGAFAPLHQQLVGVEIDFAALDPARFAPELVQRARATWQERVRTEYRSAQLLVRLLLDTLAAGDPFDAHAGVLSAVGDELRHVALCAGLVRALGAAPLLPEPLELAQPAAFLAMLPAQRALSIAISLLLVNETLSLGYIRDLHARCEQPAVSAVLAATLADESDHDAFGIAYVDRALAQQGSGALAAWRKVAADALRPQRALAEAALRELSPGQRSLEAWPDEPEVALGLFSRARQALVFEQTYEERLAPALRALRLV
jgi:hypothetical protein